MSYKFEREYKKPTVINFSLLETDGVEINATASCVTGDVVIMQDEGVSANATNLFSAVAVGHVLELTSAETCAHRIALKVQDQSSTKNWLTEYIIIETYGNEKSQHNRRNSGAILETIVSGVSGNSKFTVVDKPNDNNTLLDSVAMIIDDSGPDSPPDRTFRNVSIYTGNTGEVTLATAATFTIAAGDRVVFFPTADIQTAAQIADAVWDENRGGHTNAGSFGEGVNVNSFTASAVSTLSAVSFSALSQYEALNLDSLPTNFGSLAITTDGRITVASGNLSNSAYQSAAAVALTYNWCALPDFSADRSTINALRFLRNKWNIEGSTLSVYKENDSTIAWQADLSTVASANSIVDLDPS